MTFPTLTQAQARRFILAHQGLWPPRAVAGKAAALDLVRRLGCLQFDPLDVVGNNPALVLQARVADFHPEMLTELLYTDRALLDGWDKNMAIYPVEDWPYFRRGREAARQHPGKSPAAVEAAEAYVRAELEARGPLSSIDIDHDERVDWWWGPTRVARATLESMYNWGELIVHHRVHTRKVYDFARRHLPAALLDAPDPNVTEEAYTDWYVLRRVGSVGLLWNRAGGAWLGAECLKSRARQAAFERLTASGALVSVRVEGFAPPFYARREDWERLADSLAAPVAPEAAFIAPLDNLLWDRGLLEALFGLTYRWEVYKPAAEREYGYYVLPVLYGDRFIARCEPRRDKESQRDKTRGALHIAQWWWEPDVAPTPEIEAAVQRCVADFARYLGLRET